MWHALIAIDPFYLLFRRCCCCCYCFFVGNFRLCAIDEIKFQYNFFAYFARFKSHKSFHTYISGRVWGGWWWWWYSCFIRQFYCLLCADNIQSKRCILLIIEFYRLVCNVWRFFMSFCSLITCSDKIWDIIIIICSAAAAAAKKNS